MAAKYDFKTLKTGFAADWPVKVKMPADGGKMEVQEFMARFRSLTREEMEGITETEYFPRTYEILKLGFSLAKSEGETLTPDMLADMWATANVQLAVMEAYGEFQRGAPAKN